jgi:hypothetical protein
MTRHIWFNIDELDHKLLNRVSLKIVFKHQDLYKIPVLHGTKFHTYQVLIPILCKDFNSYTVGWKCMSSDIGVMLSDHLPDQV